MPFVPDAVSVLQYRPAPPTRAREPTLLWDHAVTVLAGSWRTNKRTSLLPLWLARNQSHCNFLEKKSLIKEGIPPGRLSLKGMRRHGRRGFYEDADTSHSRASW